MWSLFVGEKKIRGLFRLIFSANKSEFHSWLGGALRNFIGSVISDDRSSTQQILNHINIREPIIFSVRSVINFERRSIKSKALTVCS